MPFDWSAFLEVARTLQAQAAGAGNAEALLRTALSRAYFAAFCHARNYARDYLGFQAKDHPDEHGRLRAFFKTGKRKRIADNLERLRQWRNDGDYLDELGFDPDPVLVAALQEAEKVFGILAPPGKP